MSASGPSGPLVSYVLGSRSKEDQKLVFKTNYRLMEVRSIAECDKGEHSAILLIFIKLPSVFKTFVLSIFEGLLKDRFYCKWFNE